MLLEYCSERPPPEGVYWATTATKPSANFWIPDVRVANVEEVDGKLPTATPGKNNWKNGWEMAVTLKNSCSFQTMRAS